MLDLRRIQCEMGGTSSELCPVAGFGIKKFFAFKCDIPVVFYELIQCIYLAVKTQHNFIMH